MIGDRITVLIVDDHAVFAEGLRLLLERDQRIVVLGTAGSAAEGTALAGALRPQVILMDQHLGDGRGVETIGRIREVSPASVVILLTGLAAEDAVAGAIEAGASGVLEKVIHPDELIRSIVRAHGGETLFSPAAIADAVQRAREPEVARRERADPRLTERERQVLRLLAEGCDSKTIASRLGLSVHTARDHVQNVLEKMGAHSRIEAVIRAGALGLVTI